MPEQENLSTLPSLRFGLINTCYLSGDWSLGEQISGTILVLVRSFEGEIL
jgi:hypothetical protein